MICDTRISQYIDIINVLYMCNCYFKRKVKIYEACILTLSLTVRVYTIKIIILNIDIQ